LEITFRRPEPEKTMLQRLGIVILYYAFCLPAGYVMIVGLTTDQIPVFLKLMWIIAWAVHIVMSVQWVRNVRLSPVWPLLGIFSSVGSFLVFAILPIAIFVQLLLVLPGVLLACKLVAFHWAEPP
jgi:hypothetical protein